MTLEQVFALIPKELSTSDHCKLTFAITEYGISVRHEAIQMALNPAEFTVTALHEPNTIDIAHKTTAA